MCMLPGGIDQLWAKALSLEHPELCFAIHSLGFTPS
jgi:hypothetical protein